MSDQSGQPIVGPPAAHAEPYPTLPAHDATEYLRKIHLDVMTIRVWVVIFGIAWFISLALVAILYLAAPDSPDNGY